MKLTLERWGSTLDGTPGRMTALDEDNALALDIFTLEKPWRDNARMISCVPAGTYDLVPHQWKGEVDTWVLVNEDLKVRHWPAGNGNYTDADWRDLILIHPANWEHQLQGCIAPALKLQRNLSPHPMKLAGTSSTKALGHIMLVVQPYESGAHQLEIKWAKQQNGWAPRNA